MSCRMKISLYSPRSRVSSQAATSSGPQWSTGRRKRGRHSIQRGGGRGSVEQEPGLGEVRRDGHKHSTGSQGGAGQKHSGGGGAGMQGPHGCQQSLPITQQAKATRWLPPRSDALGLQTRGVENQSLVGCSAAAPTSCSPPHPTPPRGFWSCWNPVGSPAAVSPGVGPPALAFWSRSLSFSRFGLARLIRSLRLPLLPLLEVSWLRPCAEEKGGCLEG